MNTLKRFLYILIIVNIIFISLIPRANAQQKYALLISSGQATLDDEMYNSEYWYDLFLMYRMLIEDGFTHNNIYVLYGNGNDFNSVHADFQTAAVFPGVGQITDFAVSRADVTNIFNWLENGNAAQGVAQLQPGDFLYYWWMGHGDTDVGMPDCEYHANIATTGEMIRDDEFDDFFDQLPGCLIKSLYVMTCHSGGLIDDLEGLHTMIHTAAECHTNTQSKTYFTRPHAEFSYHVISSFRELDTGGNIVASDTDGNGFISLDETNVYAHNNTTSSSSQIGNYRNIAPLIHIANAQPDVNVPQQGVYSRDYAEDVGSEPSDHWSHIWFEGPDLWVRHADDGITNPQNPEFGQTNYVYARIHNIGCDSIYATANLSWCEVSAWSNPASWNLIASVPVNNLASSASRVISAPWSTVPAPGKYCLHTVLDAPGDPANSSGIAYMDNNKVQINVDIEDNVPGWTKNYHWIIENGLNELAKVDLVVEKLKSLGLLDPPKLSLVIPKEVKFERLVGAEVRETPDDRIIEISQKTQKAIIQGITLKPNEKKEAVLLLTISEKMKLGESINVKVSEQIKGREMGGIVFQTNATCQKQVLSTLFLRIGNLFKMLDKNFKVNNAADIFKLCSEVRRECRLSDQNNLRKAITEVTKLQSKSAESLRKLMNKEDYNLFEKAHKTSQLAVEKNDLALFFESQEELIFSTKSLFLRNRKQ